MFGSKRYKKARKWKRDDGIGSDLRVRHRGTSRQESLQDALCEHGIAADHRKWHAARHLEPNLKLLADFQVSTTSMANHESTMLDLNGEGDVRPYDATTSVQEEEEGEHASEHDDSSSEDCQADESPAKKKKPLTAKQAAKLDPSTSTKLCEGCGKPSDVLIRCRKDDTEKWYLLCPGKCWKEASGGKVDGTAETPFYRYGGVWKNKKAATSGKKPKHVLSK